MKTTYRRQTEAGSALLEALIAIVIFSIGLIGLLGLQSASIKNSIDAKYRSDASYLANQIISQMWVDRSNLDTYTHFDGGGLPGPFTGSASGNAKVTAWLTQIGKLLPGTAANLAQIQVTTVGSTKRVKVTVCWKGPQDQVTHNFVDTAQINP